MAKDLSVLVIAASPDEASQYVRELQRGGYAPSVQQADDETSLAEAFDASDRFDVVLADESAEGAEAIQAVLQAKAPGVPVVYTVDSHTDAPADAGTQRIARSQLAHLAEAVRTAIEGPPVSQAAGDDLDQFLLGSLMAAMTDRIYVKDLEARFIRINRAVADLFGLDDPADALGKTDFDFFTAEHAEQALADERQVIATGLPVVAKDEKETWPDGHETWVSTTKMPLRDAQGQIVGTFGISRDITEQYLARMEQSHLEAQLLQAQKMEAVGRLAGGIAHDFRNQLTVIRGYCDILLRQLGADDPSRWSIEEIRAAAERSATLTGQLLAFSRKRILSPSVLDVGQILRDLAEPVRRMLGEDIAVALVLAHEDACVLTDRTQIEQVIINLAVNARDAMPGGGQLTIETAIVDLDDQYVRLHVGTDLGPHVMIAVSDTGTGIDEETQRYIFEPFFTTKEKGKGTGLGLSMVYGFVQQSGGMVYVYSEVGRGTTFKIYLPMAPHPAEAVTPPKRDHVEPPCDVSGTETILVTEDEDAVRQFISRVLRRYGYTVLEAGNAREALPLGEHYDGPIDLLITDVVMPGMSGPELAAALAPARANMPVLFLSGYTADAMARHGILDDKVDLLSKPFGPAALAEMVRRILDRTKAAAPGPA